MKEDKSRFYLEILKPVQPVDSYVIRSDLTMVYGGVINLCRAITMKQDYSWIEFHFKGRTCYITLR